MDWRRRLFEELLSRKDKRAGVWGAYAGSRLRVEPTTLAALACLAHDPAVKSIAGEVGGWVTRQQRPTGALPLSEGLDASSWSTACAILYWSGTESEPKSMERACDWLLGHDRSRGARYVGEAIDPPPGGWPWVEGTFTWVEPTALAILALSRCGEREHPRVVEGIGVLLERAIEHGGWNAGNSRVFDRELRPQATSTALALLALASRGDRPAVVKKGVEWLTSALDDTRAAASLGWSILALQAHQVPIDGLERKLEDASALALERSETTMGLALLLLAGSNGSLGFFLSESALKRGLEVGGLSR